jgi:DNA recombination protein RmuC
MEGLWSLIGFAAGAALVFFILRSRLTRAEAQLAVERNKTDQAEGARQRLDVDLATARVGANRAAEVAAELKDQGLTIRDLERQNSAMTTSLAEREAALGAERVQLKLLKDQFKTQFAELSSNALKENSEAFLHTAKRVLALQHKEADTDLQKRREEINQLVKPIQDGIKAVGDAAKEMEAKRERAFGTIEEQIKQSIIGAADVARQTCGLKDALKRPNVRGRWGEVQLKNCIDLAGMEEHCDVEFQESSVSTDDECVRPDMTVRMPGGRKIAVDAKTPMEPFLQYVEATTDDERNAALIRHGACVRAHIAKLASRDYMQKVAESPDFVVMFLPNESFLAMALEREPTLIEDGLHKKVLVTTPGTLIGLLKVVRYGWNEQKIAVNAQLIADEGAKLNTEITKFLEDFAKLGKAIRSASEAYQDSERRVQKQITNSSRKLTEYGARSRRVLKVAAARMLTIGEGEPTEPDVIAEKAT